MDELIQYKNIHIVHRYMKDNAIDDEEYSLKVFDETKKFLYVCAKSDQICAPSPIIDDMWHTFLLYSVDYMNFCRKYLGKFIHHIPNDQSEKDFGGRGVAMRGIVENFGEIQLDLWEGIEPDQCSGPPAECHDGCCHNPCGDPDYDPSFFPRIYDNRGTILFLHSEDFDGNRISTDVWSRGIGGYVGPEADFGVLFREGVVGGDESVLRGPDVGWALEGGRCNSVDDFGRGIKKVGFTVVYPDGSTKVTDMKSLPTTQHIIWGEELISKLSVAESKSQNWKDNPAIFYLEGGNIVKRECDGGTREPC